MKTNRATQTRRSPFEAQVAFARATTALRGVGFGALAVGAVGAVAIGALAIRKLVIKRGRIERLDIGELDVGRLPNAAHESRPWRIREIAPDFILEDVWALPVHGGTEDFQTLLELMVSLDPANAGSRPLRVLWRLRDRLGSWFGLGSISTEPIDRGRDDAAGKLPIPGTNETSLIDRLPDDLRSTAADPDRRAVVDVRAARPGAHPQAAHGKKGL